MKSTIASASALLLAFSGNPGIAAPTVDTLYPYTGPDVPVGDWVDSTVNGNGKGFPRLVEPPAVKPATANPTNNINVISVAYIPNGINIHFQTPFGLGQAPSVHWGTNPGKLDQTATGTSHTYVRRVLDQPLHFEGCSVSANLYVQLRPHASLLRGCGHAVQPVLP